MLLIDWSNCSAYPTSTTSNWSSNGYCKLASQSVQEGIDEFNTAGYIVQAFPALFPHGESDLSGSMEQSITANE